MSVLSLADDYNDVDTVPGELWDLVDVVRGMYPSEVGRLRDIQEYDFAKYRDKPDAYIVEILKGHPQPKQLEIAKLLLTPPHKVICVSANNIGKSHLGGSLVNWFYDSFDPGVCLTTAPTDRDVKDVLWKEVRSQRKTTWDFPGDKAPELYDRPAHYAKGYTGSKAEAFHGRHDEFMFFILDEAVALPTFVWHGIKSMFKRTGKHFLLALLNPTDTTSPAYAEAESTDRDGNPNYHVVRLSALDHPNIIAQLKGEEAPIPGAVDLDQLNEWFDDPEKFEPIKEEDFVAGDVCWPPPWADKYGALERAGGKRSFLRPNPQGQARVLGLWPSSTPGAVWSDIAWKCATREMDGLSPKPIKWRKPPELGCDVAVGTADRADKTEIVVQIEGVALEHRVGAGWDNLRTATELKELCLRFATEFNTRRPQDIPFLDAKRIAIKIDDAGVGHGVTAIMKAWEFRPVPINASTVARHPEKYPIMRDELWFAVPMAARVCEIDLSRLPRKSLNELRRQALAVRWTPDVHGRRKVEPKAITKTRLGRSPDSMDALNLSYCYAPTTGGGGVETVTSFRGPLPNETGNAKTPSLLH